MDPIAEGPVTEEEEQSTLCADCGQEVWLERERGYLLADERTLCFACAVARGGVYDEQHDHWVQSPDLEGFRIEHEHTGRHLSAL